MRLVRNGYWKIANYGLTVIALLMFFSCSTTKFVPDGQFLLDKVKVESDNDEVQPSQVKDFVKLNTNSKLFSLFRIPLKTYSLAGHDTAKWTNRVLQHLGEEPVLYDTELVKQTKQNLDLALHNMGYLHGETSVDLKAKDKKMKVTYTLHPGEAYFVKSVNYDIEDKEIEKIILNENASERNLHEGVRLDVDLLDAERKRITNKLLNMGYYKFNKEFITYIADTLAGSKMVDLTLTLDLYRANNNMEAIPHPKYTIDRINYHSDDSVMHIRQSVLEANTMMKQGEVFREDQLRATYNNFARLHAIKYTDISIKDKPDSTLLDCDIKISTYKPSTISFQPEGTNTSGDIGAAASLVYENRNLFRGSESLSIEGRVAYEHIKSLEGYSGHHYWEYGLETRLSFPRFVVPFLTSQQRRALNASTDLSVSYNRQDRPEFQRSVLSGGWRYRWALPSGKINYRLDLINLDFVSMPWISDTFRKEYLEDETSKNAILKYNYQDLFIMNLGFGFTYTTSKDVLKVNLETAGNLLEGVSSVMSSRQNADGQYEAFDIAFAQYLKGDIDYTHNFLFDKNNSLVLHGALGIAYPYGNSNILPFEKRYFSGGANSVRGWSVRSLGPGGYQGADGRINFINQTGDMRLDLNAEWRTYLFWKFNGALFIDAGNIWTLREYKDQPGGQFKFSTFLSQIAASYGLGLRLNFDYFILRFDMAMKAVNPVHNDEKEHFPIVHPDLSRDFTFHFAVGLPF